MSRGQSIETGNPDQSYREEEDGPGIVTFTTDFGLADSFVAEMKGVVLGECPDAALVDVTHAIEPGEVREGAWIASTAYRAFPAGTIHVVVVDPGVGGARRAIAVRAHGHFFLAPDNGVLSALLESPRTTEVRELSPDFARRVNPDTTTFEGRDRFAFAAGRLAAGLRFQSIGKLVKDSVRFEPFRPVLEGGVWRAEIVRVDRFGNLVTSARVSFLKTILGENWRSARIEANGRVIDSVRNAYEEAAPGEPVLTIGSAGTLEIGYFRARADERLGLRRGDRVSIARVVGNA